jgi:hypothetical protein
MFARVSPLKYLENFARFKLKPTRKTGGGLNFHRSNKAKEGMLFVRIWHALLFVITEAVCRCYAQACTTVKILDLAIRYHFLTRKQSESFIQMSSTRECIANA